MSDEQRLQIEERILQYLQTLECRVKNVEGCTDPDRMERIEDAIFSIDPSSPGLAIRMDRLENLLNNIFRVMKWLGGGGIVAMGSSAVMLYEIMELLKTSGAVG